VPAQGVGRGGGVCSCNRAMGRRPGGRGGGCDEEGQSEHLRRPTRVTAADAFPNVKRKTRC